MSLPAASARIAGAESAQGQPQIVDTTDGIASTETSDVANVSDPLSKIAAQSMEAAGFSQYMGIIAADEPLYEATIDLSTTTTSGSGYTVNGTAAPYTTPNFAAPTVDRGLTFTTAANGKTYHIIQSGVRTTPPDPNAPKQGTCIFALITVPTGVNVTLVVSSIDYASFLTITGTGKAAFILDGTSYIRNSISVPAGTEATFSSLNGDDTNDRLIMPSTPNSTNYNASIGGTGGNPSGTITINSGGFDITARSTGAGIGGGGATTTVAYGSNGGTTTINGGTISVTQYGSGNDYGTGVGGAGIGGGGGNSNNGGTAGTLKITGGNITVRQYSRGAGIGGGTFGPAGSITIDGGNIDVKVIRAIELSGAGDGTGIGNGTGTNGPGNSQIVINGGTINATAPFTAIGRVHGNNSPSQGITITGGTITAIGGNGPGIGFASPSYGDLITITGGTIIASSNVMAGIGGDADTNLLLNSTANVRAYSGDTTGYYAAIRTKDNQGNGYYVNARLTAAISATASTRLDVSASGGGSALKTLTLPATYPCFAYSTDDTATRTDNIVAYNGSTYIGTIVRVFDNSLNIFSIIALNGYNAYNSNANNGVLPVKFLGGSMVTVTYNANGGSGTDYIQNTGATTGPVTTTLKTFAETGLVAPTTGATKFMGWNTAANGTGTSYASGQANVTIPGSMTLYAQWGDRYIVTRDGDGSLVGYYHYLSDAVAHCGVYAVNGAYTITATEDDPDVTAPDPTNPVSFPADKKITLTSATGANYTLTQTQQVRHFDVSGDLTLKNITLCGSSTGGGGIYLSNRLTMMDGAVIQNCSGQTQGGAVYVDYVGSTPAIFTMNGGSIINNSALGQGGAVYMNGATTFNMFGGTISDNVANPSTDGDGQGGGVYVNGATFYLNGGTISDNTASLTGLGKGGGVYVNSGSLNLYGTGAIDSNTTGATGDGGGLYLTAAGRFSMGKTTSISNNSAPHGNGGGIFTEAYDYSNPIPDVNAAYANISIISPAAVSGNVSVITRVPPSNASAFATRMSNPFDGTLLNNDNINFAPDVVYTDLTVSKMVEGKYADRTQDFIFTITFWNAGGSPYTGSFSCSGTAISSLDLISGSTTFTLKHGQALTISDVPDDCSYEIVEAPAPGYTAFIDNSSTPKSDTGLQFVSLDNRIDFTNVEDEVPETEIDTSNDQMSVSMALLTSLLVESILAYLLVKAFQYINGRQT